MSLPPPPSNESTSRELQHTGAWTFSTPPSWSFPWCPISSIFFEIYRRSDQTRRLPLFFFYLFLGSMHHHQTSSSLPQLPLFTRKKKRNQNRERDRHRKRETEGEKGDREILRRLLLLRWASALRPSESLSSSSTLASPSFLSWPDLKSKTWESWWDFKRIEMEAMRESISREREREREGAREKKKRIKKKINLNRWFIIIQQLRRWSLYMVLIGQNNFIFLFYFLLFCLSLFGNFLLVIFLSYVLFKIYIFVVYNLLKIRIKIRKYTCR